MILLGSTSEIEDGEKIKKNLPNVRNWCGKTSLNQVIAILSKAKLLISNDSGTMHLMAALKKPQIAIFGSSSPDWTSPLNPNAEIIYQNLDCSPCFQRDCPKKHLKCLFEINPRKIANISKKKLSIYEKN